MINCVFCGIIQGKISADIVYEDDQIVVFPSIDPKAKLHLILIPKTHVEHLDELDNEVLLKIKDEAMKIVRQNDLTKSGYRLITNGGAAKAVPHLHFHLLGEVSVSREV